MALRKHAKVIWKLLSKLVWKPPTRGGLKPVRNHLEYVVVQTVYA